MCEELRVDGGTSKSRLSANPPARPHRGLCVFHTETVCLVHRDTVCLFRMETLCLAHTENARYSTKIMKIDTNQVAMAPFGAIFGQNPPHGVWEASGMPPGL